MNLYAITGSELLAPGVSIVDSVKAALRGGADVIQLREKQLDGKELVRIGKEIKKVCEDTGALFAVNDRIDVALLCQADMIHLGQDDISIDDARQLVGSDMRIGISTHDVTESRLAKIQGAHYIGLGPVYPTSTKKDAKSVVPSEEIKNIRQAVDIPIVAIGGITLSVVDELIQLGVDALAIVSGIFATDDIEKATQLFRMRIDQAKMRKEMQLK
ncbi:thiamine phosphate synthase [Sulfoacidibacillus ferrooxidans]|uniref:Thiamine-phosphate synthase n=1 Tax=Sulfoacidibacillus ferrooxidans TaxID=2005001 RepID=A0A9X2AE19_9BACL|nr:Thiamine-phosphate synthase [Sulfoacidibacillus ferrooxidans]